MKRDVRKDNVLAQGALIVGISVAGILVAQGFNKMTSQAAMTPSSVPPFAQRQSVLQWFTKYDAIRRQAQMTPQEKSASAKLMTQLFTGASHDDKAQGAALLSKMIDRYGTATNQLKSLPSTPPTAALQKGYVDYFTAGQAFFSKYLDAMNNNEGGSTLDKLRVDRLRMGSLDMYNKALDKHLRRQYGVRPYKYY